MFVMQGCNTEPDVAPMPTYDGQANMTIAELVALHTIGSLDSYDTIPAGTVISGIVTTSDEWGNNYKYINIEDETGGVQIKINSTALYNKFKVGQRVFVKCDGLHIGDYRKLPQIGIWAGGSMQPIPSSKIYLHFFPDGEPQKYEPKIILSSIPKASELPKSYINSYVRLENASFAEAGSATFSEPNASTSRDIVMEDGTVIVLRTSNYAKFASSVLPAGKGTIDGILTIYNSTVQLVVSSLNDLYGFTTPQSLKTIFTVDYSNAFNQGWSNIGSSGNMWMTLVNSSYQGFYVNRDGGDATLLSPVIDLSETSSPVLQFTHRANMGFIGSKLKCRYTTNYIGEGTEWVEVPLSTFDGATSSTNEAFPIPEAALSKNFRFAFFYENTTTPWYVSNIRIDALVK